MTPISKTAVREFSGKIIGWVETDKDGNQQVRTFTGKIIGKYDKSLDCTRTFTGKIITKGNTAVGLLYMPEYNPDFKPNA